jgi:hypothetical protein
MIDIEQEEVMDLSVEEQASVLLDVFGAVLAEAVAQGLPLDLSLLDKLSLEPAGEGDIKLTVKMYEQDAVEYVVPVAVVEEALGELAMPEEKEAGVEVEVSVAPEA